MPNNNRKPTGVRADDIEDQLVEKPAVSNALRIKPDHMKKFTPLTENQRIFFEMYDGGGYFMFLLGSSGTGKCQGEDVEVNLLVSDELYEKLTHLT